MKRFTLNELENMENIEVGWVSNLKYDDGEYRVWLSRLTVDDEMEILGKL